MRPHPHPFDNYTADCKLYGKVPLIYDFLRKCSSLSLSLSRSRDVTLKKTPTSGDRSYVPCRYFSYKNIIVQICY